MDKLSVLFATDFSKAAKLSLERICELEQHLTLDVALLHVITSHWKDWLSSGIYEKEVYQRLETWQQKIISTGATSNQLLVQKGNAANAIVHEAKELNVDLIVMGGDSEASQKHFLTGTTAAAVVRASEKSVLLFKKNKFNKVLCGVDGSESSLKALQYAIDICKLFNTSLSIVYAIPRLEYNPLGMTEDEIELKEDALKKQKIEDIEKILSHFDFSTINVEKLFPWGIPSHVMLNLAEDFSHDLVIIGAKGHSSLSKTFMGSTAERILRYVPCSLLVIR